MDSTIKEAAAEFYYDVLRAAETSGEQQTDEFLEIYGEAARENGELEHIDYCSFRFEGTPKYGIDGYYLNLEFGELFLVISDYHPTDELESLNKGDVTKLFTLVDRFFDKCCAPEFINTLEETGPAFQAAYYIYTNLAKIKRVRVILFSNAVLAMRNKTIASEDRNGRRFSRSVLDFRRFYTIQSSSKANDPIEIDFGELGLGLLPCLKASKSSDKYESYLVVMPAEILAKVYRTYGARLLEANVRTFLQARTKVNKGIINTIENEPENFFAYNNGLTATADEVYLKHTPDGTFIERVTDLQIVNGGQTTASILYADDIKKTELSNVFVQMKLSRAIPEVREELIPKISRFANSQNKVTEADLFSNHKFHIEMEKISRHTVSPPIEGALVGNKWFYERARGQYRDAQSYMSLSKKKKFLDEYPRSKMLLKTDLAKSEMTFMEKPHHVSLGAGKCFSKFADLIDKQWIKEPDVFGEEYFKKAMCHVMIFRWTDKHISTSEWYKAERGFKSQIVTYTIAAFQSQISKTKASLDFVKIWRQQEVPKSLQNLISDLAPAVGAILKSPPPEVRNIAEYCKRQYCWERVKNEVAFDINPIMDCLLVDEGATKRSPAVDAQIRVQELADEWAAVHDFGQKNDLLGLKEYRLVGDAKKIKTLGKVPNKRDSLALIKIYKTALNEGYQPSERF